MAQTAAYSDETTLDEPAEATSSGFLPEIVVQVSMMLVIAALGMALRTSFGLGMISSVVIALGIYWCLLVIHALVRRGQMAADLSDEVADLADENAALRRLAGVHRAAGIDRDPRRLPGLAADRPPPRVLDRGRAPESAKAPQPAPIKPPVARDGPAPKLADPAMAKAIPAPVPSSQKSVAGAAPVRAAAGTPSPAAARQELPPVAKKMSAPPPGPSRAPPPPLPRPRGLAVLAAEKPVARLPAERPRDVAGEMSETPEMADPRAQDVAIMQSLIKGLADQINGPAAKTEAPRAPRAPERPIERPMERPVEQARERVVAPAPAPQAPILHAPAPPVPLPHTAQPALDTVEDQVGALREMADDMRDSFGAPHNMPHMVPAIESRSLHDELERAIDAARIDVCLDPILGLDDRRTRHFEVSVRLRSESGEILDPREFAGAISGTGLTPRIEALTFTETVRLAGEFAARGAVADLFSEASGESLRDGGFHAALGEALAPDVRLGARLVMSISQSEVRAFGPAHWQALAVLSEAGLRYALVDVVDLDMDFEGLVAQGFEFVRLDADVFLQGLPAPHGIVPAADLCRYLSGLGFTLIVSRIGEERDLAMVLGFGALLGQGRLFGGPRPIRQDRPARRPNPNLAQAGAA